MLSRQVLRRGVRMVRTSSVAKVRFTAPRRRSSIFRFRRELFLFLRDCNGDFMRIHTHLNNTSQVPVSLIYCLHFLCGENALAHDLNQTVQPSQINREPSAQTRWIPERKPRWISTSVRRMPRRSSSWLRRWRRIRRKWRICVPKMPRHTPR